MVLLEEKADLEALHDINEEMQENARQGAAPNH
jgi:hypothetical protein